MKFSFEFSGRNKAKALTPQIQPNTMSTLIPTSTGFSDRLVKQIDIATFLSNWTYSCVIVRVKALSNIAFYVADDNDKPIANHWFNMLMQTPNQFMQWKDIVKTIQKWLDYSGNSYLLAEFFGTDKSPLSFIPLPSTLVTPAIENGILIYKVQTNIGIKIYDSKQIVHFKTPSISNNMAETLIMGKPELLLAATDGILTDENSIEYLKKFFFRDAIAPLVIKVKENMDLDGAKRLEAQVKEKFPNLDVAGVLEGNTEIAPLTSIDLKGSGLPTDIEASVIRRLTAIFGVPQGLLTGEFANRSTSDNLKAWFYENTVEDLAQTFEYTITKYLRQFESNIKLTHDKIQHSDFEREIKKREFMFATGTITRNELREEEGLSKLKDGDKILISTAYTLLDNLTAPPQTINPVPPQKSLTNDFWDIDYNEYPMLTKYKVWKAFDDMATPHYYKINKALISAFNELENIVIANIKSKKITKFYEVKEGISSETIFDIEKALKQFMKHCDKDLRDLIKKMLKASADLIDAEIVIDDFTKTITDLIDNSTDKIRTSINTVHGELKDEIKGIALANPKASEKELLDLIVAATSDRFTSVYKESRARMIARTTTTSATTGSERAVFTEFGFKYVWVSQRDGKVRDTHKAADGKHPNKEGYFTIGSGYGKNPGDLGSAAEDVNCRCYLFPTK